MIVIDTETTGMGEEDQVVEFAMIWLPVRENSYYHFLINPSVPVNVEARAVHHIPPSQLAYCADAATWRPTVETQLQNNGTLVFHNAEFDLRLIRQTWPGIVTPPFICTWRCALHMWPESPSHSNQVLRYWLGLEPAVRTPLPPHRALPDAAVTAAIVLRMLHEKGVPRHASECPGGEEEYQTHLAQATQELIELTQKPVVLYRCGFGKHRGELWSEVPRDYLQWIARQPDFDADTMHTAKHYLGFPSGPQIMNVVYRGTTIETGGQYTFSWKPSRDEGAGGDGCSEHNGQVVTVTKLLHHGMVAIRADDGWEGNAFHHELRKPDARPDTVVAHPEEPDHTVAEAVSDVARAAQAGI